MKKNSIRSYIEIILAMLFWSASFIWYKEAYLYLQPITLVFFRVVVSAIFLFGLIMLSRKRERIKKKDLKYFFLLGFVEPLIYFLGESHGMMLVSSIVGSIIISTIPLFIPFAALIFFKEKVVWIKMFGIGISFTGILIVLLGKGFQLIAPIEGIALMFLAVFAAVGHAMIILKLIPRYQPVTIIFAQSLLGVIYFLPIFLITDLNEAIHIQWNWAVIEPIIKLGIFPSSLSFILYTRTVKTLGITRTNVFANFIPVFTAIMAYVILKEEMTTGKIIGILVVLAGLLASQSNGIYKLTLKRKTKRFH